MKRTKEMLSHKHVIGKYGDAMLSKNHPADINPPLPKQPPSNRQQRWAIAFQKAFALPVS